MRAPRQSGFFQEDNGNKSMTRLMFFICVLAAIYFGHKASSKSIEQSGSDVQLVVIFLAAGAGSKVSQKFAESPKVSESDLP